jgi:hypothetical protein
MTTVVEPHLLGLPPQHHLGTQQAQLNKGHHHHHAHRTMYYKKTCTSTRTSWEFTRANKPGGGQVARPSSLSAPRDTLLYISLNTHTSDIMQFAVCLDVGHHLVRPSKALGGIPHHIPANDVMTPPEWGGVNGGVTTKSKCGGVQDPGGQARGTL